MKKSFTADEFKEAMGIATSTAQRTLRKLFEEKKATRAHVMRYGKTDFNGSTQQPVVMVWKYTLTDQAMKELGLMDKEAA